MLLGTWWILGCAPTPEEAGTGTSASERPSAGSPTAIGPGEPVYQPSRETVAEGVVLLAEISAAGVSVHGVLEGPQHVDLDQGPDERHGFRYRVRDARGEVIFERSTVGPALVEAFLAYWSGVAGIDILAAVPQLGRFPVTVPLLPEARTVDFEVRDAMGVYQLRGSWDYAQREGMRVTPDHSAILDVALLHGGGAPAQRLDVVLLPDGYREQDLSLFHQDAEKLAGALRTTAPLSSYADRITITRVDVASEEAGASFDCDTCGSVHTAFGSIFPIELINRTLGTQYDSRSIFQTEQWKIAETLSSLPWDQVIVVVNSQRGSGMAVHYAVVTRSVESLQVTGVHEFGHAFGMLGDEYVSDDCIRTGGLGLPENITDRPDDPPWAAHIAPYTPLPTPEAAGYGVGAFQGAWNCEDLYRPAEDCRMVHDGPFCPVCSELLVRRMFRFIDPADSVQIVGGALQIEGALPDTALTVSSSEGFTWQGTADAPPELPPPAPGVELTVELAHRHEAVLADPTGDLRETWTFSAR
jgi:hypothetical protein